MKVKWLMVFSLCALSACSTNVTQHKRFVSNYHHLVHDEMFNANKFVNIQTEQEIFKLNAPMQTMVKEKLLPIKDLKQRTLMLLKQIFLAKNLGLVYQGSANLSAVDTYTNAKANCLSLTIMAYALAKAANLPVRFQQVKIPEFWVREGDYNLLTGHVNLQVQSKPKSGKRIDIVSERMQIDFDPFTAKKLFPTKTINKESVVAMFYNNIGAEFMINHQYDKAFQYFKAAINQLPDYSSAWGNLALLYRKMGQGGFAEQTYRYALALNPENYTVLANLALLLQANGALPEAAQINAFLARKRKSNPYYFSMLADEAVHAGKLTKAVGYYKQAIRMNNRIDGFYAGIAKVYYRLKQYDKAKGALKRAIVLNKYPDVEAKYTAKLYVLEKTLYDN